VKETAADLETNLRVVKGGTGGGGGGHVLQKIKWPFFVSREIKWPFHDFPFYLVCDVRADLFCICETWLKDHHSAVLSELTPSGYKTLVHCPRPGCRGGGTALLVKEGINVSNVYSDEKTSFEVSEWLVSFESTRVRIVIVYRPPYSEDHPITAGVFFHEFAEYLESVVMSSDKLLITGDINFHMDVPTDPNNIHFRDL